MESIKDMKISCTRNSENRKERNDTRIKRKNFCDKLSKNNKSIFIILM